MHSEAKGIIYALRRTLPVWSFEENLRELDILKEHHVEELIVKVDTEEFSHGHVPLEFLRSYQEKLFRIREKLEFLGIRYSINPWATQGHADRGRYAEESIPGVQTMVDFDGSVSTGCACPLSPAWQKHITECWRIYAETKPHIMWVEDDIRSFNHGVVRFGCFCPLHMKRFSELAGKEVSREELVSALVKPGVPHPWRRLYLQMQSDIMIETVKNLAQTVHKYSPDTCMGLMSSGPRSHTREGRRWKEFAEALADGKALYSRPPTGVYQEHSIRDNYFGSDFILLTRAMMPENTIEESEVDNWNFSRYSKSVSFTALQMGMSAAYGCAGITLNLYDHAGTPMADEPEMGEMLKKEKPFLDALAGVHKNKPRFRGVQMLFSDRYSELCHLPPEASPLDLTEPGSQAVLKLGAHGIPVVYSKEPCKAACGQSIRAYSDEEIFEMLGPGQGLFLDAEAALVLFERGMGDLIGVEYASPVQALSKTGVFSAEEFYNPDFGGKERKFLNCWTSGSEGLKISIMDFAEGAVEISRLVDPDLKKLSLGMCAFESPLGGRVVVSTQSMAQAGIIYNHTHRRQLLEGVFGYLSYDNLPVVIEGDGVYPQVFRSDSESAVCAGFFNLSLDGWNKAVFRLGIEADCSFKGSYVIAENGEKIPVPAERKGNQIFVEYPHPVAPCRSAVVVLEK